MKISIITPTWNSDKTIKRCLDSVSSQIGCDIEHLIIDNQSADKTLSIANSYPKVKIHSEIDEGISDAFNKGIKHATGDIIAILNSDDCYIDKNIASKIVQLFVSHPEISFIHGDMLFIDPVFGSNLRRPLMCSVEYAMPYNHPTMFVRKEVYEHVGTFKNELRYCMDLDLVCRIHKAGLKGFYFKVPITEMHAGGASDVNDMKVLHEYKKVLKLNNKWTLLAKKFFIERMIRMKLKSTLKNTGFSGIIKIWRRYKWSQ